MRSTFATLALWMLSAASIAEELEITIVTEIRPLLGALQVGMKSTQTISIDSTIGAIKKNDFKTGVTNIGVKELKSVRDKFTVNTLTKNGNIIGLSAQGQTASAISFFGDIDYKFSLSINTAKRKAWVSGCHNEYPSYSVSINGKKLYDREQTGYAVGGLIGSCDVVVTGDEQSFP